MWNNLHKVWYTIAITININPIVQISIVFLDDVAEATIDVVDDNDEVFGIFNPCCWSMVFDVGPC